MVLEQVGFEPEPSGSGRGVVFSPDSQCFQVGQVPEVTGLWGEYPTSGSDGKQFQGWDVVRGRECRPSLLVRAVDWPVYLEGFEAGHAGECAGLDC